jgi:hypothetical protein
VNSRGCAPARRSVQKPAELGILASQRRGRTSVTKNLNYTNSVLAALDGNGVLRPPVGAEFTLAPIGAFFELRIALPSGAVVTAVLSGARW